MVAEVGAQKLLQKGRLRVEYNWCRVEARVELTQCFKCWRYGHLAASCGAPEDRRRDCRQCGQKGHQSKECDNEKNCPVCGVAGHAAGTGRCPATKLALRRAREEGTSAGRVDPRERARVRTAMNTPKPTAGTVEPMQVEEERSRTPDLPRPPQSQRSTTN